MGFMNCTGSDTQVMELGGTYHSALILWGPDNRNGWEREADRGGGERERKHAGVCEHGLALYLCHQDEVVPFR